jgi:FMN-dependent NADH-azoreductase
MPQSLESQTAPEGFEFIENTDEGIAVRLPNSYEVVIGNASSSEDALSKASTYYEKLKQDNDKDELTYTDMLATDRGFLTQARKSYAYRDAANQEEDWFKDDIQLTKYFMNDMRWRDNNTVSLVKSVMRTGAANDAEKERTAYLLNTWDAMPAFHETGGSGFRGLLNNIKAGAADPTSYIGAGLFAVGKRVALGVVGKEATKQIVKRSAPAQIARSAATGGAADAGMSGAFSYLDQTQRLEANMIDEIDYGQVIQNTAIGAASGGILGAGTTLAFRSKPVVALRESQMIKNVARKAQLLSNTWLSSTGMFDPEGAQIARTGGGRSVAAAQDLVNNQRLTESQILKAFDAEDQQYSTWIAEPENLSRLDELVQAVNNSGKKIDELNQEPMTRVDPDTGEVIDITPETNANRAIDDLNNNPELKESLTKLAEMQTSSRKGITENLLTPEDISDNPFADSLPIHQTVTYYALTDADFNLKRLTKTTEGKQQFEAAVKYMQKKYSVNQVGAQNAVNALARGRLDEAKSLLGTTKADANVLRILEDNLHEATIGDVANIEKFLDPSVKSDLRTSSPSLTDKKKTKEVFAALQEIPKEVRNILGIVDDPLARATEAARRLGSLERATSLQNELSFHFIKTGQVDRFVGNTTFLDTPIAVIGKTLREAVKDGNISTAEGMRRVVKENETLRSKAFETTVSEIGGKIYNPLALLPVDKDFHTQFRQAMHGTSFNVKGDGILANGLQAAHSANFLASSAQTVFSPATQTLNFIGGVTNFVVANGFRRNAVNLSYMKNTYLPIFAEVFRGNKNNEDAGQLLTRLTNKKDIITGKNKYTSQQIDDVMEDFRLLTEARIIDSDVMSDFGRMMENQTKVGKASEWVYDKSGYLGIKQVSEFTKRTYAASDELFKVMAFKDRKEFFLNRLGYTKEEAIKRATKDIYRWYPNYRFQPKLFKATRSVGLGNFIAHTIEITRNTKNIMVDTSEMIAEGASLIRQGKGKEGLLLISDATRRGARAFAVIGASSYAFSEFGNLFGGQDTNDEERRGLMAFSSDFYANQTSSTIVTDKDEFGNLTVIGASMTNPFGAISDMAPAIMKGADELLRGGASYEDAYSESFSKALKNYFRPFGDPTIGTGVFVELLKDFTGPDGKAKDEMWETLGDNAANAFTPGFLKEINAYWEGMKPGNTQPDTLEGRTRALRLAGLRPRKINFGDSTVYTYRALKFEHRSARGAFSSSLARGGLPKSEVNDIAELELMGKYFLGIKTSELIDKERNTDKVDLYVEKYRKANEEMFILERELHGKALAHVNYLRQQEFYKGEGGQRRIFNEVSKRMQAAKLSKKLINKLVGAATYNSRAPVFQPFILTTANLNATRDSLTAAGRSREEANRIVNSLRNNLFEVARDFRNRPLTIRNADEDE